LLHIKWQRRQRGDIEVFYIFVAFQLFSANRNLIGLIKVGHKTSEASIDVHIF